jgi:thiol-disulfide isomerase/thioredoxin
MRYQASLLAAGLAIYVLAQAAPAAGPEGLADFNRKTHQELLDRHKGDVVLLNFWATWCAPCREEMPLLVDLARKLDGSGFRLITVSADEPEDRQLALDFLRQHGVPAPAYMKSDDDDNAFINAIHPKWSGALPALFLYDRQGRLQDHFVGETQIADIEKAARQLVE